MPKVPLGVLIKNRLLLIYARALCYKQELFVGCSTPRVTLDNSELRRSGIGEEVGDFD